MPLEVRRITIQMQVADEETPLPAVSGQHPSAEGQGDEEDREAARTALVEQCVEAVLAELARRAER